MAPVVAEALGFSPGCGRGLRQPGALVGHSVSGAGLDGGVVCVARAFWSRCSAQRKLSSVQSLGRVGLFETH